MCEFPSGLATNAILLSLLCVKYMALLGLLELTLRSLRTLDSNVASGTSEIFTRTPLVGARGRARGHCYIKTAYAKLD